MWHSINMNVFNPYLSYETNRKNGVDLPEEWMPVLVYDPEDSEVGYFVGRFYQAFNTLWMGLFINWAFKVARN